MQVKVEAETGGIPCRLGKAAESGILYHTGYRSFALDGGLMAFGE